MSELISYINGVEDKIVTTGAKTAAIKKAQSALKLCFSSDYYELVKEFGCLLIKGETIFGVVDNESYDVVSNTLIEKSRYSDIPNDCYVISSLGIEGVLILQNSLGKVFEYSFGSSLKMISNTLLEYLESL